MTDLLRYGFVRKICNPMWFFKSRESIHHLVCQANEPGVSSCSPVHELTQVRRIDFCGITVTDDPFGFDGDISQCTYLQPCEKGWPIEELLRFFSHLQGENHKIRRDWYGRQHIDAL